MSVITDPRFVRRRAEVREGRARRALRKVLRLLAVLLLAAGVVWAIQSPFLSVRHLRVEGRVNADAAAVLAAHDVYVGRPLVRINEGGAVAALLEDPWVRSAVVSVSLPNAVSVEIEERVETAIVGGFTLADDGRVMRRAPAAPLPRLALEAGELAPGVFVEAPPVQASLVFLSTLPPSLREGATVRSSDGELWATISGHEVRLGGTTDPGAKATAVAALLAAESVPPGAIINVVAPGHPAISGESQPLDEG